MSGTSSEQKLSDQKASLLALFREHSRGMLVFARGLVAEDALAEDAVQQAFLNLAARDQNAHGRDIIENPRAYLYGAVRNAALNLLRGERRRERAFQDACRRQKWAVFTEPAEDLGLDGLNEELAALPAIERQVVLMKVWGGLTFEEIGRALETPAATAATRYRTALSRLKERLVARGWP
jgi:RNA polymerase sigma-70 factor (ECF subfamily)